MAVAMLYDAEIVVGTYDLSGDHNSIKVETTTDALDCTVMGAVNRTYCQGIRSMKANGSGFVQFDDSTTPKAVDFNLSTALTAGILPVSIAHSSADGATAYLGQMVAADYMKDINVTELGKFDFSMECANRYTRGFTVLPLQSRVASVTASTIYQLGALSSSQRLLANLHVTAFTGTSLVVTVQRNDTNNTTTPATAITFTTATGVTSEAKELAGPITDTYFYVTTTFTGTSYSAFVTFGIAPR